MSEISNLNFVKLNAFNNKILKGNLIQDSDFLLYSDKSINKDSIYLPKLKVNKNLDENISKALQGFNVKKHKSLDKKKNINKKKDIKLKENKKESGVFVKIGKKLYIIAMKAKGALESILRLVTRNAELEPIFGSFISKLMGLPALIMHAAESFISGDVLSMNQLAKDLTYLKVEIKEGLKLLEKKLGRKLIPRLVNKAAISIIPFLGIGVNLGFAIKEIIDYKKVKSQIAKKLYLFASILNGVAVGSGLGSLATAVGSVATSPTGVGAVAGGTATLVLKSIESVCSFVAATCDIIAGEIEHFFNKSNKSNKNTKKEKINK